MQTDHLHDPVQRSVIKAKTDDELNVTRVKHVLGGDPPDGYAPRPAGMSQITQ